MPELAVSATRVVSRPPLRSRAAARIPAPSSKGAGNVARNYLNLKFAVCFEVSRSSSVNTRHGPWLLDEYDLGVAQLSCQ